MWASAVTRSAGETIARMRIYAWARYHAVVTLAHVQSNPFYRPFYHDVTHVRKIPGPLPLFRTASERKAGRGLGTRLGCIRNVRTWV